MKDILIIGNFGYEKNDLNGQTVKTRIIKDGLEVKFKERKIRYIDTANINIFKFIILSIYYIIISKNIIILPGKKALMAVLPITLPFKILKKRIDYVVIGGWLKEFLDDHRLILKLVRKVDGIYVELPSMIEKLNSIGLKKVYYMPNARFLDFNNLELKKIDSIKKIVFLSRVTKTKGVSLMINAFNKLKNNSDINLDIYGPVDIEYEKEFFNIIGKNRKVEYRGIIEQKEINRILKQYDLMIFPTFYEGEGFPGVFIDAFYANLPILCSDWKYNTEIIKEKYNGITFKSKDENDLIKKIEFCFENLDLLNKIKKNQIEEIKNFEIMNVLDIMCSKW